MQILSQLASAEPNPIPRSAASPLGNHAPSFEEAFRTAATQGEAAGKPTTESGVASEDSSAANLQAAGKSEATLDGPVANSSALPATGLSGVASLRTVTWAGADATAALGASALRADNFSARAGETRIKKTASSDEQSGVAASAPATTPESAALAITPLSTPVNADSALEGEMDASVPASDATNRNLPASANQQVVEADSAAEASGDVQPTGSTASPATTLPATITTTAGLVANASTTANQATQELSQAHAASDPKNGSTSASHPKTTLEATSVSSSEAAISSATNGTQTIPFQFAAQSALQRGTLQDATLQDGTLSLASSSSVGASRSGAGDVRGKRKETAADGSSSERDSTITVSPPFASRLAEAQAPAQAGASTLPGDDPAVLQRALEANQSLASTLPPASTATAQTAAPPVAPSTPAATNIPLASAETVVIPGASSAQLIQSAGQTEMRLGMHSAEFGNISISTSVSHQTLSAQISLDHSELGRALAVHLPAIEAKLGSAYGLEASVQLRHETVASRTTTDSGQAGGGQEQTGGARNGQSRSGSEASPASATATTQAGSTNLAASSSTLLVPAERSRLDIRI